MSDRDLGNTNVAEAAKDMGDLKVVGDGDLFVLLCKASSHSKRLMKSCKAMEIPGVGCVVQVTTKEGDAVAEALTFVPGVTIVSDGNGGRRLVQAE